MNFTYNLIINVYSIIILIVICVSAIKLTEKESFQDKLYMMMILVTILMLSIDILSRFDGKPDTIYLIINNLGNFLIFMLNPILPSLWLLYVHIQIFHDERKTRQLIYPLLSINIINDIILILSQFYGCYYYIDLGNIYHRGPLFLLAAFITILLMLVAFVIIVKNHNCLERKSFFSLVFFAIPPFVCIILQIAYYGASLMLNGVVISLLVVFLNIQNRNIYIDHLTGVNNRKKLDAHLKKKISASTAHKSFAAIMLDLDNFKTINDTFGHDIGDKALEDAVQLLRKCIRVNDFIARYGGDEFIIILDMSNRIDLEAMVNRINKNVVKFNESGFQPYKIEFSMGYTFYDYYSHMNGDEFMKKLDTLMYENKQGNKNI